MVGLVEGGGAWWGCLRGLVWGVKGGRGGCDEIWGSCGM